ncbi:MAG: general secretion pathway protein GspB [Proteobacteria bacterium]|nr:general secretion pathway protein GspB [Pseudomonadota bacterium]
MSFILDALKKSEAERQQQGSAEFSSVPSSTDSPRPTRWLWMLAALLGFNLAVLLGLVFILNEPPEAPAPIELTPDTAADDAIPTATTPSFVDEVAKARERRPVAKEPGAILPMPSTTPPRIPIIDELRLNGTLQLAELHIDIHVYSEVADERFVFINMVKHRENSQLDEGPIVAEITPDGVILEYHGLIFLLPRE